MHNQSRGSVPLPREVTKFEPFHSKHVKLIQGAKSLGCYTGGHKPGASNPKNTSTPKMRGAY